MLNLPRTLPLAMILKSASPSSSISSVFHAFLTSDFLPFCCFLPLFSSQFTHSPSCWVFHPLYLSVLSSMGYMQPLSLLSLPCYPSLSPTLCPEAPEAASLALVHSHQAERKNLSHAPTWDFTGTLCFQLTFCVLDTNKKVKLRAIPQLNNLI